MTSISDLLNHTSVKHKSQCDELIYEFMEEINKERGKRKPLSFMGVKMKLIAIKNNEQALYEFLNRCKDYKNRNGSFSKCFFGSLKIK